MATKVSLLDKLKSLNYDPKCEKYRSNFEIWGAWYQGKVKDFHEYQIYNGDKHIQCERAQFQMAKIICETWASLLWNRECRVTVGETNENEENTIQDTVVSALQRNNFTKQFSELIEQAFAVGTGGLIVYEKEKKACIDYINVDYIFPLAVKNGEIINCAFVATDKINDQDVYYFMIHEQQTNGKYRITNKFFRKEKDGSVGDEVENKNVLPVYDTNTKRFFIIKPAIANNIQLGSPWGVSVYANAIDSLKNIDLAFDGTQVAMKLGRPRIGVTGEMMKITDTGDQKPKFDTNDTVFYQLSDGIKKEDPTGIQDLTTQYRANEFENSLQVQITLCSTKTGLGEGTFRWDNGNITTATQVVSENSSMARNMRKHQDGLEPTIKGVVKAILDIEHSAIDVPISIQFDDSVVIDTQAEQQKAWQWVLSGKMEFWRYLHKFEGYGEEEAKQMAEVEENNTSLYEDE